MANNSGYKNVANSTFGRITRSKYFKKIKPSSSFNASNVEVLKQKIEEIRNTQSNQTAILEKILQEISRVKSIAQADFDNIDILTKQICELRKSKNYNLAFTRNPLISIRIGTYNRADILLNTAIPSILKQTYQNFEVVVVGDHCTDDTEARLKNLNDKRIKFYNLPSRSVYPENRILKWRVIGTWPINMASGLSNGSWIAPIDDDDEFTFDHLEKLLKHAQQTKCEMVYGALLQKDLTTNKEQLIWSSPPESGKFGFQGAIYMRELDNIFKYNGKSWVLDEVNDWNMCRRMIESGVKISCIKDIVGKLNMIPPGHARKDY